MVGSLGEEAGEDKAESVRSPPPSSISRGGIWIGLFGEAFCDVDGEGTRVDSSAVVTEEGGRAATMVGRGGGVVGAPTRARDGRETIISIRGGVG